MKKFKIIIVVRTEDIITKDNFEIVDEDVLDGFILTREGDDRVEDFKFIDAYIESVVELETDERKIKIGEIKRIIEDWGPTTSGELELDHSPCLNSMGNGKKNVSELIEYFNRDGVGTIVYQDELELDENDYPYDELSDDILEEVYEILTRYDDEMNRTMDRIL